MAIHAAKEAMARANKSAEEIDAVIISHDHYDHLEHPTIIAIKDKVEHFFIPLGLKGHFLRWGVNEEKITELDGERAGGVFIHRRIGVEHDQGHLRVQVDLDAHHHARQVVIGFGHCGLAFLANPLA